MSTALDAETSSEITTQIMSLLGYLVVDVAVKLSKLALLVAGYCLLSNAAPFASKRAKGMARRSGNHRINGAATSDKQSQSVPVARLPGSSGTTDTGVPCSSQAAKQIMVPPTLRRICGFLESADLLHLATACRSLRQNVQIGEVYVRFPAELMEQQGYSTAPLQRLLAAQPSLQRVQLRDAVALIGFAEAVVAGYCAGARDVAVCTGRRGRRGRGPAETRGLRFGPQHDCSDQNWEEADYFDKGGQGDGEAGGQGQWASGVYGGGPDSTWMLLLCSRLAGQYLPMLAHLRLRACTGLPGLMALACALEGRSLECCVPLKTLQLGTWAADQRAAAWHLQAILASPPCQDLAHLSIDQPLGAEELEAVAEGVGRGTRGGLRHLALNVAPPMSANILLYALADGGHHHTLETLRLRGFAFDGNWPSAVFRGLRELGVARGSGLDGAAIAGLLTMLGQDCGLTRLWLEWEHTDNADRVDQVQGALDALAAALCRGALPQLQHLALSFEGLEGVGVLMSALAAGGAQELRSLTLDMGASVCAPGVESVAEALAAGPGWDRLNTACPHLEGVYLRLNQPADPMECISALQLNATSRISSLDVSGAVPPRVVSTIWTALQDNEACVMLRSMSIQVGDSTQDMTMEETAFALMERRAHLSVNVCRQVQRSQTGLQIHAVW